MRPFGKDKHSTELLFALESADPWRRISFMLSCCERMLPNHRRFAEESGFGKTSVLREAFDAGWRWIGEERLPDRISGMIDAADAQAPDTEDFSSEYASAALDAASAACAVLSALRNPEHASPTAVSVLACDSVDVFVQRHAPEEMNAASLEKWITNHPLVLREIDHQRAALALLLDNAAMRSTVRERLGFAVNSPVPGSLDT